MRITLGRALAILVVLAGYAVAAPAAAQKIDFGVRASAFVEDADPALGLELVVPFGDRLWAFNPNAEVVFGGERDRWAANLDVVRVLRSDTESALWAGAGLALIHTDDERRGRDDTDDAGLNLLVGMSWRIDDLTPYGQVKVIAADDAELVLSVGIRF
jgi:hypothetical protein